ncbi:MAG: OmpA family protein [Balneola sp.]
MFNKILTGFFIMLFGLMINPTTNAQTIEDKTWFSVYLGHQEVDVDGYSEMGKFNIPRDMGGGISIQRYLNDSFDANLGVYLGRVDHEFNDSFSRYMINTNLTARYKFANGYIIEKESTIKPYLLTGLGYSWFAEGTTSNNIPPTKTLQIPFGAGFEIPLNDNVSVDLNSTYNSTFTDEIDGADFDDQSNDHVLIHTIGLKFRLGSVEDTDKDGIRDTRDECINAMGTPATNGCPDRDGDTVIDSKDRCPNQPGLVEFAGCPDTDKDGVVDYEDRCPNISGLAKFDGCADSDSDAVADNVDECPNVAGTIATKGCPDSDGDRVIDSKDVCPNKPGTIRNEGCPNVSEEVNKEVNLIFNNIYFATDEAMIHESSMKSLDKLYTILNDDEDLMLKVSGHADSRDDKEYNLKLSKERAQAVKSYLVQKGIPSSRITTEGFGETKPIASNTSKDGKTRNRRVELTLSYN